MARFKKAVENIVTNCLRIKPGDRTVVITDNDRLEIGEAIAVGAAKVCPMRLLVIEDYTKRPAKNLPTKLASEIKSFHPTVSVYAATGKKGELQVFRMPLLNLLTKTIKCRHGHMISINEEIMLDGMSQDYKKIYKTCHSLYKVLSSAKKIEVTDPYGTSLVAEFSSRLHWKPDDGVPAKKGDWCNLPSGEVFTCPKTVNGKVVALEVGDYFSDKYGLLKNPITLTIENSFVTKVESKNKKLEKELWIYLTKYENGNRVGEFAIGCLLGLKKLMGNLLRDEKFPGVHMAFGHPYPDFTGQKSWDAPTHVDIVPLRVTAKVDDKLIFKDGRFANKIIAS